MPFVFIIEEAIVSAVCSFVLNRSFLGSAFVDHSLDACKRILPYPRTLSPSFPPLFLSHLNRHFAVTVGHAFWVHSEKVNFPGDIFPSQHKKTPLRDTFHASLFFIVPPLLPRRESTAGLRSFLDRYNSFALNWILNCIESFYETISLQAVNLKGHFAVPSRGFWIKYSIFWLYARRCVPLIFVEFSLFCFTFDNTNAS